MFGSKKPKNTDRYFWTDHSFVKMRQYGISESLVKRIISYPERVEEGVLDEAIAAMRKSGGKNKHEIWVMYLLEKKAKDGKTLINRNQIRIITAWRYPGESPKRNPIPQDILDEVNKLI